MPKQKRKVVTLEEVLIEHNKKLVEVLESVRHKVYSGCGNMGDKLWMIPDDSARHDIDQALKQYTYKP